MYCRGKGNLAFIYLLQKLRKQVGQANKAMDLPFAIRTSFTYVSYQGIAGKYYKAYVCIWAGKNGSGDTRYMWATM